MNPKRLRVLLAALFLALYGCAQPAPAPVPAPREIVTYYYVGALEFNLKAAPDPGGADGAMVRLNDRVQSLERRGAWFLVRTANGQEGWANERDLKLDPINQLYVRRGGALLRQAPADQAGTLERLRVNDQVKLLEQSESGWVRVTVARTRNTGWLKSQDLSLDRVSVPRPAKRRRPPSPPPESLPGVTPSPAEAAPPPAEVAPPPADTAPPPPPAPPPGAAPRKAKPEMFEPF